MKSKTLCLGSLFSLLLVFFSPVHPALNGATVIDFEGLPLGTQTVFTLSGVSISNSLSIPKPF